MAQVLNRVDDYNQETADDGGLVLDGPYAHIFLAKIQRDLQQSVNAGKKAYKKNKKMSHTASLIEIEEPPKHEPPAKPLPADNLKSCIKKEGKGHKAHRRKVTWAPGMHDPAPSASESNTMEWPKSKNKNKKNLHHTSDHALDDVSNKGPKSKGDENVVLGEKYKDPKDKGWKNKEKKKKNQVEVGSSDKKWEKKGKERGGKHNRK